MNAHQRRKQARKSISISDMKATKWADILRGVPLGKLALICSPTGRNKSVDFMWGDIRPRGEKLSTAIKMLKERPTNDSGDFYFSADYSRLEEMVLACVK